MASLEPSRVPQWTPAPMPAHWGDSKRRAVALCNAIPAGRWTTFTNLAEAFNRLAGSKHNGFTFARLINDIPWRRKTATPGERYGPPTVPWHRIRNDKGQAISYDHGPVTDNNETWANVSFNDEANGAGLLHDGMARTSLWIDIDKLVARGEVVV
jgi:hypothetical protein